MLSVATVVDRRQLYLPDGAVRPGARSPALVVPPGKTLALAASWSHLFVACETGIVRVALDGGGVPAATDRLAACDAPNALRFGEGTLVATTNEGRADVYDDPCAPDVAVAAASRRELEHAVPGRDGSGGVWGAAVSPAGWVALSSNAWDVAVYAGGGAAPRRVAPGHGNNVPALDASPCGGLVASASIDGTVRVWRAADGAELMSARPFPGGADAGGGVAPESWMWNVRWLPRGSVVGAADAAAVAACSRGRRAREERLVDAALGREAWMPTGGMLEGEDDFEAWCLRKFCLGDGGADAEALACGFALHTIGLEDLVQRMPDRWHIIFHGLRRDFESQMPSHVSAEELDPPVPAAAADCGHPDAHFLAANSAWGTALLCAECGTVRASVRASVPREELTAYSYMRRNAFLEVVPELALVVVGNTASSRVALYRVGAGPGLVLERMLPHVDERVFCDTVVGVAVCEVARGPRGPTRATRPPDGPAGSGLPDTEWPARRGAQLPPGVPARLWRLYILTTSGSVSAYELSAR